ncbi:carbamoyltransferase C-terminal domain-containing protein [Streptomyces sp. NPDC048290]|uniref:carbamoyltransferase family protein n=1 Tax=Streptomyces sp. NPDC048290 TaxID=3155811 RepID=UPI0034411FD4
MNILGINCVYHESSAALIVDGDVLASAEEERFNRVKHGKPASVSNADVLPEHAIAFCLEWAGITPDELDLVAISFAPELRGSAFQPDPLSVPGVWGSREGEATFRESLSRIPGNLSRLLGVDCEQMIRWIPHHLAHAASAYYPCGDDRAAVLVVDGIGESTTALIGGGKGTVIEPLGSLTYPDSMGFVWEKISAYLGFSPYDASKVMGLASYGDPAVWAAPFAEIAGEREPKVRSEAFEFRLPTFGALEERFGPRRLPYEPLRQQHMDLAAALQSWNDRMVLGLAERTHALHPAETLCFAGGVALNCTTNWVLKEKGPFSKVFIPSAPHDGGTAIGAALAAYFETPAELPRLSGGAGEYLGPDFTSDRIRAAFADAGIRAERCPDIAHETARRIARGEVVGWFQGRMELGPRALGNRSLLADPRDPMMRDKVNVKVKHRETFRPFAPSVLAERAGDWFELGRASESYRYMLYACPVRPDKASHIPAVVHVDGTSRIQTVVADVNPRFHRLIREFEELTGVPVVLNTSFNDSEPIVCTPSDALATFKNTQIDAIVIGDYLATR